MDGIIKGRDKGERGPGPLKGRKEERVADQDYVFIRDKAQIIIPRFYGNTCSSLTCDALSNTNLACPMLIISHAPDHHVEPRRNSLTISYVKNDVAMLGATFTIPIHHHQLLLPPLAKKYTHTNWAKAHGTSRGFLPS